MPSYRTKKQLSQYHKQPVKDKSRVLCPLTFHATNGRTATNYTVDWASTIELSEFDESGRLCRSEVGVWRSQAKNRAFEPEFKRALARLKAKGLITWEEDSYYFFDDEGQETAMAYIDRVVRGELRAHARSWRGRFEKIAGVSIEELKSDYPGLYGVSADFLYDGTATDESEATGEQAVERDDRSGLQMDPEVEVAIVPDDQGRMTVIGAPEAQDWLDSEPPVEELLDIQREQKASFEEAT